MKRAAKNINDTQTIKKINDDRIGMDENFLENVQPYTAHHKIYSLCPHKHTFGEDCNNEEECAKCKLNENCASAILAEPTTINELMNYHYLDGEELGTVILFSTNNVRFIPLAREKRDPRIWNGIVLPKKAKHGMQPAQRKEDVPIWKTYKTDYTFPTQLNTEVKALLRRPNNFSITRHVKNKIPDFNSLSYSERLKHPKWQQKRLKIFEKDDWTCQTCGETENTLHCHHIDYIHGHDPWDYPDNYFITLCEDCHEAIERAKKRSFIFNMDSTTVLYGEHALCIIDKTPKLLFQTKEHRQELYFEATEVQDILNLITDTLKDD